MKIPRTGLDEDPQPGHSPWNLLPLERWINQWHNGKNKPNPGQGEIESTVEVMVEQTNNFDEYSKVAYR